MDNTGNVTLMPNEAGQIQAINLMALQNMQNYLKMLVFNINVVQQDQSALMQQTIDANNALSPTAANTSSPVSSDPRFTPISERINRLPVKTTTRVRNQKSSGLLWDLMSQKYSAKKIKKVEEESDPDECSEEGETYRKLNGLYIPVLKNQAPPVKRENICGHPERSHYARGLCGSCYHRVGRGKKPWNCSHDKLYALGLCHKCYTAKNRQMKKDQTNSTTPIKQEDNECENEEDFEVEVKQEF
mmetsp:Transcript_79484/g.92924  ORF Transcript_79484/g.92924 Transcript_79484/m.92924 type:complete len:244 (+) Transcript_79484:44-775(+)